MGDHGIYHGTAGTITSPSVSVMYKYSRYMAASEGNQREMWPQPPNNYDSPIVAKRLLPLVVNYQHQALAQEHSSWWFDEERPRHEERNAGNEIIELVPGIALQQGSCKCDSDKQQARHPTRRVVFRRCKSSKICQCRLVSGWSGRLQCTTRCVRRLSLLRQDDCLKRQEEDSNCECRRIVPAHLDFEMNTVGRGGDAYSPGCN